MYHIAPSLFCANPFSLRADLATLERLGIDWYHFDIMDGSFVGNFALGTEFLRELRHYTDLPIYVHLMAHEPERHVASLTKAGANYLCFHIEAVHHPFRLINEIKAHGAKPCVAISPFTPVASLESIINDLDVVTLMSMEPGFLGQPFMERSYAKIKALKQLIEKNDAQTLIEIDGAVDAYNGVKCLSEGADVLVAGFAFVFKKDSDIETEYEKFINNYAAIAN